MKIRKLHKNEKIAYMKIPVKVYTEIKVWETKYLDDDMADKLEWVRGVPYVVETV